MDEVTITREMNERRGRYVAKIPGSDAEAELTFLREPPNTFVADHTLTPVALRGRGIATKLVERMVADARREGFRIRPLCPFVVSLFSQRPEWADLEA
ncbi:MAG TPA: GNAT family N-acetyltransferase [Steroidobacteraceae bacterium]|nr:GNAT family N-acetyltransferase [Steroidobacteraceae bacterium]